MARYACIYTGLLVFMRDAYLADRFFQMHGALHVFHFPLFFPPKSPCCVTVRRNGFQHGCSIYDIAFNYVSLVIISPQIG